MPKSSRGGKAGATTTFTIRQPAFHPVTNPRPTPQPAPQPVQQPVQQVQPIQQNQPSSGYDAFKKMTDDQKADVILQVKNTPVPTFLSQSDTQKVLYGLNMNDKPTLVDDSVLDTMPGKDLFRTVNDSKDTANRMKWNAREIADQTIRGSVTRVSDSGGSAYGRGVYFADNYYDSTAVYGQTRNNISKTAVIRAKLSPTAKTIGTRAAQQQTVQEIKSGSKLGKAISTLGLRDQTTIWALAKGYDAMVAPNGYHVIINRSALVASKDIRSWNNTHNW
jgi:hypothetical protein